MKLLEPGTELDGFVIDECVHAGGMAHVYRVHYAAGDANPGFDLAMKVPRMTAGDGAENLIGFEVELQILPLLQGIHVPRFVAAGDLERWPYLVMEYIPGHTLGHWLAQPELPAFDEVARLGSALAHAVHRLHQQNTVHLDLKPDNVMIHPDGHAVLLDFGLSCSSLVPDLLAEQLRRAVGSPAWIAPEQVVGVRGDPRSDIFAAGAILYQLLTGELPFGAPQTPGGLRQRLWMDPPPPRRLRPEVPPWLQEVVLRCLAPQASDRYPSAAHLAFDLQNPEQVQVTARGLATRGTGWKTHFKRWWRAAGMHYEPSPPPAQEVAQVPIVMVAVPHQDASDATLYTLRQAAARSLGNRPGAQLACVTVIPTVGAGQKEVEVHRRYLSQLKAWSQPLLSLGHQISHHVLESGNVAEALLRYAEGNEVSVIVLGAATHGLKTQRWLATVPMRVAMEAPCTVILVKQALPFAHLGQLQSREEAEN